MLAYGETKGGTSGAHALISGWQVDGAKVHVAYSWC